ncbi:glycosyltransferase [Thermococcus sp. M36]|uniref:glycosyltransferase n=1 Tax=Thermococcus sp. M36 TaxID=1638261 RepID=UPI00143B32DA|nr:glycosyltransferase [Thermococcus sp. M36]
MIFIVLPCYNEGSNLVKLIPKIGAALEDMEYIIIAVNDGSVDDTASVLSNMEASYPLRIVTHEKNRGLQAALRSGLLEAVRLGREGDVVVTMDADDTHDPRFIHQMLESIQSHDIVIASRYVPGGAQLNVPSHRVFLSRAVNILVRLLSGIPARDLTSGYRAYRWECIKGLFERYGEGAITSHGFEVSVELLVRTYILGCKRVAEVPLVLDYGLKEGESKMNLKKTIWRYIKIMPKIVLWRFSA